MVPLPPTSPVICVLRMKVAWVLTCTGLLQVRPLSVERTTKMFALGALKSFQEIYILPKCGEDGLLSAQPDSRSAEPSLKAQKWVQLFGSEGVVDLYAPNPWPPQPTSSHTVNQVAVGLLYRRTGSPTVLSNGLWPLALVRRVKVLPPSVEVDAPEMLMGVKLRPRESL